MPNRSHPELPHHEWDELLLPEHTAADELPEAFGQGAAKPPAYEAFGRGEPRQPKDRSPDSKKDSGDEEKSNGKKTSRAKPQRPGDQPDHPKKKPKRSDDEEDKKEESSDDDQAKAGDDKDAEEDDKNSDDDEKEGDKKKSKPSGPPLSKRPAFLITAILVAIVLIVAAVIFWLWHRQFVSTDDASIDGHITQISPQISAPVKMLHVDDNQLVHKGDLLVELDPTDFQVALDQAQAQVAAARGHLDQAQAQIISSQASIKDAAAEIDAAQATLDNATREYNRYQNLDERARSQQQVDNAATAKKNAQAQLNQAQARRDSALANVALSEGATKAAEGDVKQAEANVERNQVNLGYCRIVAPSDGRITERTIENGTFVAPGQAMFTLVSPEVWVTANFKETQLTLMKPGQPVTISVDAFPGKKFEGTVDSIQAGSGSRFSVLPAENATGNFVKTVQRVPVKIVFNHDANTDDYRLLSPGLSVVPRVKVR